MKLVDILARELAEWPVTEGVYPPGQDYCVQSDECSQVFFCGTHGKILLSRRADKTSGVRVTRAEWQAAVDALNAPKVVEWDGAGLPPVGAECEMKRLDYVDVDWQQIKFLCAGEKKAFFMDSEGYEWSRPLTELKFRPIRNAEQVAAEEREKAIKQMVDDDIGLGRVIAEWVYDAGYRKQVAK